MPEWLSGLFTPEHVITIVIIVFSALLLIIENRILNIWVNKIDENNSSSRTFAVLFERATKYITVILAVVLILQINGINVSSIITGLGIVSLVVGLGIQEALKDIIQGIHINKDHFFNVGDVIEYNGHEGKVIFFSLTTTKIQDIEDKSEYTICNRNITDIHTIKNILDIDLPLPYTTPYETVHKLLKEVCTKISQLDKIDDCIYKGTEKFDTSSILYKIRVFSNPEDRNEVRRSALRIIEKELDKADIHIPYNQLDVHISDK